METIIIQTEAKKAKAIKQFLKAFDVSFSTDSSQNQTDSRESPYNPEFVKKILKRRESARQGNVVEINPDDLWGSLGLK